MLGCEGVKVYQFFYQSEEDFQNMKKNNHSLFIVPPLHDANVTIFEYDFGKHIPLQLIFDVFEQSKYFRLRVGQVMKIIQYFVRKLLEQSEKNLFNHDLDPKNIWILFSKGQLGPEFNDDIDFDIQIQGRWKSQNVQLYLDKIFNILQQLTIIMEQSIPKKQRDKQECKEIIKLQQNLLNLYTSGTIKQLYNEIQKIQMDFQQNGFKLKLDTFESESKRTNRIKDASKDIKLIFKDLKPLNSQNFNLQNKMNIQFQFYNNYDHIMDFIKHFQKQQKDTFYSKFQKANKKEIIDLSTFNYTKRKVQEYHTFKINQLPNIPDDIIIQTHAIRGFLNYPNKLIYPSIKINILIRDSLQFYLGEAQNMKNHIYQHFQINHEMQSTIDDNFNEFIFKNLIYILIQTDMEQFQNQGEFVKRFQDDTFKQYQNCFIKTIKDLF